MSFPDFRMRRIGLTAAAVVAALTMVTAAAAQSMVVRSTGPSAAKYPTGARLKSTDKLTLVAGDRIVLMQSRSEEHTSELQSLMRISYAVFCLKKKKKHKD